MAITYATRTAIQQADPIVIRIGTRSQLSAAFNNGAFTSSYGRNMFIDQNYSAAPANGAAVSFPAPGSVANITVDRSSLDNTFLGASEVAIGDNLFSFSNDTIVGPNLHFICAKTPMPVSGAAVETRADISIFPDPGPYNQLTPISSILDSGGTLRAAVACNLPIADPLGGDVYMINVTLMTALIEKKWEGLDLTISGFSNMGWRPKNNGLGNWGLFSGVYTNTNDHPLLIDANLAGVENGRYNIQLSDPTWNAVFSQPPATFSIAQILPCNVGWVGAINTSYVTPPSFFVLNEDMTKYWVYVIEGVDADTIAAIFTSGWGASFFETIWIDSPITDQGTGGEIQILGAVGNPSLLMQNVGAATLTRLLLPPYPPIISAKCVPCAPLQFDGPNWQFRAN